MVIEGKEASSMKRKSRADAHDEEEEEELEEEEQYSSSAESEGCGGLRLRDKRQATGQTGKHEDNLLPGPKLGNGPRWVLHTGGGCENPVRDGPLLRCGAQLEQALSESRLADVRFVFDDDTYLSGHWSMLCGVSAEFRGMFESGMAESTEGIVRVRGVSRASFKGFLEWVYLGRAGKEMGSADGREAWLLADVYGVKGIKEWLMGQGLSDQSVCAAAQYGMEGDGGTEGLLEACQKRAAECLAHVLEAPLLGVGAATAQLLLEGYLKGGHGRVDQRTRVVEGFKFVKRWAKANGFFTVEANKDVELEVRKLLALIDLSKMSSQELKDTVRPSGLVNADELLDVYEGRFFDEGLNGASVHLVKAFGSKGHGPGELLHVGYLAVCDHGERERIAVCDYKNKRVLIYMVDTGECVCSLGTEGDGPGQFQRPRGLAFNSQGHLIVTDREVNRVQVFDRDGMLLRSFGRSGTGLGEFSKPSGVAVNNQGDIVVCDTHNNRVQVFREDGTFVLAFGSKGSRPNEISVPKGIAVMPDGCFAIVDSLNTRIQVFSPYGSHVRSIGSKGDGPGQFQKPYGIAVGARGEILVADWGRHDVQVFSNEGVFLQSIGSGGDSKIQLQIPNGVAIDRKERIFVGNMPSGVFNVLMLA